jgi:hypothetical protein
LVVAFEEPLAGGWQSGATKQGRMVLRRSGPQSRTVLDLLRHMRAGGVDFVPEPIGAGFAADGREQLTFIDGASVHPRAWSDEAVWRIGAMLRTVHDSTSGFDAGPEPVWRESFARSLAGGRTVCGHGDLGPWNILARDGEPVAIIDWDDAGPIGHVWDLANMVWLNAHLHDDDVVALHGLPSATDRVRQARLILDGYRLAAGDRIGFVARMIEFAVRSAREEAVVCDVGPTTHSPAENGFPILWAVTWRVRAAAWMLDHRTELEAALER